MRPIRPHTNYRPKSPAGTLQARIFRALAASPNLVSSAALAGLIGVELTATRDALRTLCKGGYVVMIDRGRHTRYKIANGAKEPKDCRGTVRASLENLTTGGSRGRMWAMRHRQLHGPNWRPVAKPAIALEECWPVGVAR